jgi:hypothetical protein
MLISSRKSVSVEDLLKHKYVTDAVEGIADKEIQSLVNQDIDEVRKYFEQRLSVRLPQTSEWMKFRERFYRRNIIVHSSGITNRIYRAKTAYRGKDRRLFVTQAYLKESFKLFENAALKISEQFDEKFGKPS